MGTLGGEPRPLFQLVNNPSFKLVRLADMDPGMVPKSPIGKVETEPPAARSQQKGREMITVPALRQSCAGIDVGKRELAVAIAVGPVDKEAAIETRMFGTTVPALQPLRCWLEEHQCSSVAIESTGSYWIPVKNVLEGALEIVLVCSRKHHPKKGEKTDFRDAIGLAHYHRHGLLTGSYLPKTSPQERRED